MKLVRYYENKVKVCLVSDELCIVLYRYCMYICMYYIVLEFNHCLEYCALQHPREVIPQRKGNYPFLSAIAVAAARTSGYLCVKEFSCNAVHHLILIFLCAGFVFGQLIVFHCKCIIPR